jgi:hypothetical protein
MAAQSRLNGRASPWLEHTLARACRSRSLGQLTSPVPTAAERILRMMSVLPDSDPQAWETETAQ